MGSWGCLSDEAVLMEIESGELGSETVLRGGEEGRRACYGRGTCMQLVGSIHWRNWKKSAVGIQWLMERDRWENSGEARVCI